MRQCGSNSAISSSSPRKKPFNSRMHRNNLGSRVNWTLVHLLGANGSLRHEFRGQVDTLHPVGAASWTNEASKEQEGKRYR